VDECKPLAPGCRCAGGGGGGGVRAGAVRARRRCEDPGAHARARSLRCGAKRHCRGAGGERRGRLGSGSRDRGRREGCPRQQSSGPELGRLGTRTRAGSPETQGEAVQLQTT